MKTKVSLTLKILVSAGFIAYVFLFVLGGEGLRDFAQAVRAADKSVFFQFFFLILIVNCIGSTRWWLLLRVQGINIPLTRAAQYTFIGLFFNFCMPGITGGDLVKAYYIMRETPQKARAVATIVVDRILGLSGIAIVSGTAISLRLPFLVKQNPEFKKFAVTLYVFIGAALIAVAIFFSRRLRRLLPSEFMGRIAVRLPFQKIVRKLIHVIKEMDAAFFLYRSYRLTLITSVIMSAVIHLLLVMTVSGYGGAIGIERVSAGQYYTYVPIILLATALPISVAGWGVGETLFVEVFGEMGVAAYKAVAVSILYRLTGLIWSLPGMVFYLLVKGREKPEEIKEAFIEEEQELEEMAQELQREEEG
jgi:uncharacterized protein (TIRG00374 family)